MLTCIDLVTVPRRNPGAAIVDWRKLVRRPKPIDATIGELSDGWLEHLAVERPDASHKDYRSVCRKVIKPAFGDLLGRDLGVPEVVAWVRAQDLSAYKPKTILKHLSFLSSLCEYGRELGALELNPTKLLPPGTRPSNRVADPMRAALEVLELDALRALTLSPVLPFYRRLFWALLLFTGARFGEAAALRWGDYTPGRQPLGELVVRRSWQCRERKLKDTKTHGIRHVPVHPVLARILSAARIWVRDVLGRTPTDEDLIAPFPSSRLDFWHETTALRWWHRDLELLDIAHPSSGKRRVHAARHTFVSRLLRAGADWRVVETFTHTAEDDHERSSFAKYAHFDWQTLCRAMSRLEV